MGMVKGHSNGIRDLGVRQQLCLGGKRTLNEALGQTLQLEVVKLAVRSSITLWKTSDRALWRSWHSPKDRRNSSLEGAM